MERTGGKALPDVGRPSSRRGVAVDSAALDNGGSHWLARTNIAGTDASRSKA
jgi:hypothetical protein